MNMETSKDDESFHLQSLLDKRTLLQNRIQEISGIPLPIREKSEEIKTDLHWDYLLKEVVSIFLIQ